MITDEELAQLPEEPDLAFVEFERIMREKSQRLIIESGDREDPDEYRLEYFNKVLAAAKSFNIEIFKNWKTPSISGGNIYVSYKNFLSDVDHYTMQIRIQSASSIKKFSVSLEAATKVKIHHLINQIKDCIEQANLEDHKKNRLYDRIDEFCREVDKARTPLKMYASMAIDVCSVVGEGAEKLKPAKKFLDSISVLMGNAKNTEENIPRISYRTPPKLEAPRQQITYQNPSSELIDEEIPF